MKQRTFALVESRDIKPLWKGTVHPARLEEILGEGVVICHLCPRNCNLKENQLGFCSVRANQLNRLVTLNYGKSVHASEETIETEAVFHYSPGERILSLGNIGCNLNCMYCQNWKTSQAKFVSEKDIYVYTPEYIVEKALRHGIRCLSWTYNDPVVWHEFVCETAKLANEAGLINLYKSAFYITEEAVDELLPYIDIFSISIKSMDPMYYTIFTKGQLKPILNVTKQVYKAGKHLEVSNLMITDISDTADSARQIAEWVLTELNPKVPLHYVRFHPDYKVRNSVRTPISRLIDARKIALDLGVENVYVGNVYDIPWSNSYCYSCGAELVTRYGLNSKIIGLDSRGLCQTCGHNANFKVLPLTSYSVKDEVKPEGMITRLFNWHGDIRSLHVQMFNTSEAPSVTYHRRLFHDKSPDPWTILTLNPGESYRFALAKSRKQEIGPEIVIPVSVTMHIYEVFDRAHFPTVSIEDGVALNDLTPLPYYHDVISK